jgi:ABC-type branched-subunit amino acid transport system ATPase component/ABC-type branched-subunit amino acid transport system permease subunit
VTAASEAAAQSRNGQRATYLTIGTVVALTFPWFVESSVVHAANLAAYYAMVAVSLVVLVGWVGQISLGQAGLVGVGAYVSGHVISGWHLTFPVNMLWAGLAGAVVAGVLGVVAVRVRGLYLAVATLIFSWMAVEFLFRQEWFTKNASVTVRPLGEEGLFPYFDWTSRRTYYYAAWAVVATAIYLMANLRDSKTGRAFFAVRGSEVAAASMGIDVVRTKLVAFAVSGALAGMAGNLLLIRDQVVTPDPFEVETSLFFLAVAVVGGLSSLGGAVAAALLFASLDELYYRLEFLSGWLEVVPPVLLTAVLLLYRGGLAAIPVALGPRLRPFTDRYLSWIGKAVLDARERMRSSRRPVGDRRAAGPPRPRASFVQRLVESAPPRLRPPLRQLLGRFEPKPTMPESRLDLDRLFAAPAKVAEPAEPAPGPAPSNGHATPVRDDGGPGWRSLQIEPKRPLPGRADRPVLIEATGVTVRFGGLVAVNDVSLTVREHEIVGLIGPNGAGKTTTFNSIAGLNVPTAGRVRIFGYDVTRWSVDERARLGVGRTFQAIQLLPQLTVFDNLLVATHVQNGSGLLAHLFAGSSTLAAEREARRQVRRVARLLELEDHLDRLVADLPFGVLRMVELARALVTGSRLIMLDEPASGLDNTETDRLAEILRFVRDLGVTLLLIEHDVKMVTSVSDYMYVLDYGTLLAEGTPAEIQRDPRVIAAYLGESAEPQEAPVS